MPTIPKILTTTALCLAAVGLSSCVTTVHRYAWNRAKVIDEAYWVQDAKNIELYRVGDTVYAKGFIGPARGGQATDDIPARVYFTHGGAGPCFNPIEEHGRPVYIRVRDGYTKLRKDATSLYASSSGKNAGNVLYVHWYAPLYSSHLTELPAGAVRLTEHGSTGSGIEESDGYKPHTDVHKYYAYPLGGHHRRRGGCPADACRKCPAAGRLGCYDSLCRYICCLRNLHAELPGGKANNRTYTSAPELALNMNLRRTMRQWFEPIIRMWRFSKNNGITEGFLRKIKGIQRRGYGYRNFENYKLRVLVECSHGR